MHGLIIFWIVARYKVRRPSKIRKIPVTQEPQDVLDPSNSIENEEVVKIIHGFKPDFNTNENESNKAPKRTMEYKSKSKRSKRGSKKGKRVLKRRWYHETSQQSSYSSLISEYIFESGNDLELNSNLVQEMSEQPILENEKADIAPIREISKEENYNKSDSNENNVPNFGYHNPYLKNSNNNSQRERSSKS